MQSLNEITANTIADSIPEFIRNLAEGQHDAGLVKQIRDNTVYIYTKLANEEIAHATCKAKSIEVEKKLRLSLELSVAAQAVIDVIKNVLTTTWRDIDTLHIREHNAHTKIQEVLLMCENYETKNESEEMDAKDLGQLAKYKSIILRDRDRQSGEVIDLEKRLQLQRCYTESLEYINKSTEEALSKLMIRSRVLESEKTGLELKNKNLRNSLSDATALGTSLSSKLEVIRKELAETKQQLQEKTTALESEKYLFEKLRQSNVITLRQLGNLTKALTQLQEEKKKFAEESKMMIIKDKAQLRQIDLLNRRLKDAGQEKNSLSSQIYRLDNKNMTLAEEIKSLKNMIDAESKKVLQGLQVAKELNKVKEGLENDKASLLSTSVQLQNKLDDAKLKQILQNRNIQNLMADKVKLNAKIDDFKLNISRIEKEKTELAQEKESLRDRIDIAEDEIQMKNNQITNLTEQLQAKTAAHSNVKKQLEAIHAEKLILKRNYDMCSQERDNNHALQLKLHREIQQLTNQGLAYQSEIQGLNMKLEQINNEKKNLIITLQTKNQYLGRVLKDLKNTKDTNHALMEQNLKDEKNIAKHAKTAEKALSGMSLMGLQMLRRNDEIVLLKKKYINLQMSLDKVEEAYNRSMDEVKLTKTEIRNLKNHQDYLTRTVQSTAEMRLEIVRLERLLNGERMKLCAITDDNKNPTVMHHWRFPNQIVSRKGRVLKKIQVLYNYSQKTIIQNSKLAEHIKTTSQLNKSLAKVVDTLSATQKEKTKPMKSRYRNDKIIKALKSERAIDQLEIEARNYIISNLQLAMAKG